MQGDLRLALTPEFSAGVTATSPVITRRVPGAAVQTWSLHASSLRGESFRVSGLEGTMTDALVRVQFADGTEWNERLTPSRPESVIPARPSGSAVAGLYLHLGVEHILTGVDHLLFVLALLILTRSGARLLGTITAFTIAHSITLAAATLGWVHVPQPPVEAVIALSIAFVAAEIVRGSAGQAGASGAWPWVVAFIFGLLHGLGFAGGLAEVGLPQGAHPGRAAVLQYRRGARATALRRRGRPGAASQRGRAGCRARARRWFRTSSEASRCSGSSNASPGSPAR